MSRRFRSALTEAGIGWDLDVKVEHRHFEAVPRWQRRLGDTRSVIAASTRALAEAPLGPGVTVVVNGWEMGVVAMDDVRVAGVILAMDMLPTSRILRQSGLLHVGGKGRRLVRKVSSVAHLLRLRSLRRKVVGILPMSEMVAAEARRIFDPHKDVLIRTTWSPQKRIATTADKSGRRSRFRAIFVANHLAEKGADTFVDGVNYARQKVDIEAAIVSNAPEARGLLRGTNIELILGLSTPDEIHKEFRGADVSVLPTRRDQLPNVIAESLAAGTPVIATAVGAIPELVISGKTGWLLPRMASGEDLGRALVDACRGDLGMLRRSTLEFARAHLGWHRFVTNVGEVVQHALRR